MKYFYDFRSYISSSLKNCSKCETEFENDFDGLNR